MRTALSGLLLVAGWLAAVAAGHAWLQRYEATAGPAPAAAPAWPAGAGPDPTPGRPTLLMFAHPHCPCTRAALAELAWIVSRADGADVRLFVVAPPGAPADWADSPLARAA